MSERDREADDRSAVHSRLARGVRRLRRVLRHDAGDTTPWLAVALGFVAAVRLLPSPEVFRGGDVVLSSNDPYMYRYLVERVTASASGLLDIGTLLGFPDGVATGEPLLVATLSVVAELLGGGSWATGVVLAVYPVASALVTALAVYLLATSLSDDARVGLAAVGFFAVVPGHAFRTGIGFADHHAFDYPWLALTALAFVVLATDDGVTDDGAGWPWSRRTTRYVALLGVGVAGQVLSWNAGPLLLVPLALGVAVAAPVAVADGRVSSLVPLAAGVGLGAALSLLAHVVLGWQTLAVASTPALVWVGAVAATLGALAVDRLDAPAFVLAGAELAGVALGGLLVAAAVPELVVELERGVEFLFRSSPIGEMQSLTDRWGLVFGPLIMLGFTPFLAVPAMLWSVAVAFRRGESGWLLLSLYAWTFLALSFVQRRFTGELAPFAAVFAGLGFVGLVSWFELARGPRFLRDRNAAADGGGFSDDAPQSRPDEERALAIPGRRRFVMLGGFAAVFAGFPGVYSAVIHTRVTIDSRAHAAARWMAAYADARGWEYPDNYVFSEWGRNRMYNYFVSGESASYGFARRNYSEFLFATDPETWYERLSDRTGFVVTTGSESDTAITSRMQDRLHEALGSRSGNAPGLAHYRAVYASDDGQTKVFTLVPGATIVGTGPAESTVSLGTSVSGDGVAFEYERRAETDADGGFSVTVAHPGTYEFDDGRRVSVPESAVLDGASVRVDRSSD